MKTRELIEAIKSEHGSDFENCRECTYGIHNEEVVAKLNRLAELEDQPQSEQLKEQLAKEILQSLHYEINRGKGVGSLYADYNYGLDTALGEIEAVAEKYGVEIDE